MARFTYKDWQSPGPTMQVLLQHWKGEGLTDQQLAWNMGISRRTLWRWRKRDKQEGKKDWQSPEMQLLPEMRLLLQCLNLNELTDQQIAENLGVSRRTISMWQKRDKQEGKFD